jgi:hypothetical protein
MTAGFVKEQLHKHVSQLIGVYLSELLESPYIG